MLSRLLITCQYGVKSIQLSVKPLAPLYKLKAAVAPETGRQVADLIFLYKGRPIKDSDTLLKLEVEDEDVIYVVASRLRH